MSRINSFQTLSLTTIKWPNLGHETSATLPFHVWSSYSMSCLKQPTTNCSLEIRETSWAVALFSVVVSSLMTSQRRIFAVLEQFGVEGFCRWSEWCVYKFWAKQHTHALLYSTFTEVWFRSVSKVFCHIDCVNQNRMCCNWRQRHSRLIPICNAFFLFNVATVVLFTQSLDTDMQRLFLFNVATVVLFPY